MEELESQVAKIQIGNPKQANSYVYVLTEKTGSEAELYIICELPLFNPAAEESCEKICLALAGTLRRSYRRALGDDAFENAVAQINDELGKLASIGQAHWIEKLNCVVSIKQGSTFHIATCGKISAFLFRQKEYTDISCSAAKTHPLKPFENVASGKIKLDDMLILSTTQLFNYLSMDRLKNIFQTYPFPTCAQAILTILKDNAGPEVAFGTIFILEALAAKTFGEQIQIDSVTIEQTKNESWLKKSWQYFSSNILLRKEKRQAQIQLPDFAKPEPPKNINTNQGLDAKIKRARFWALTKNILFGLFSSVKNQFKKLSWSSFKGMSIQKKIFFVSVVVLLIAFVVNLSLTSTFNKRKQTLVLSSDQIKTVQDFLTKAQSAILYKESDQAHSYLTSAINAMPALNNLKGTQKSDFQAAQKQIDNLKNQMENVETSTVTNLGSLGNSNSLISLPQYFGTQVGSDIIAYNRSSQKIEDGTLRSSQSIVSCIYIKDTTAVVYNNNGGLLVWNYGQSFFGPEFNPSVPAAGDFAGLKYYSTNNRVYIVNKKTGQILSFLVSDKTLQKPVLSVSDPNLTQAIDLAIDGNIYVLTQNGINKYAQGHPAAFTTPTLFTPLSGKGKIATDKTWKNIYVLDVGNNRILIIDKKGNLVETVKNDQFKNLKDFFVDEPNKTIYVLNDNSLLKVNF